MRKWRKNGAFHTVWRPLRNRRNFNGLMGAWDPMQMKDEGGIWGLVFYCA